MIRGTTALDLLTQPVAEKLVKNQEQIYQLHEVLSTLRLDKQNALVRRLVQKTQDGTLGTAEPAGGPPVTEEDETVSFGDTVNTYNLADRAAPAVAQAAQSLWPYVLAAALGGTGLGAAAMALPTLLKSPPASPVVQPAGPDADTQYTLGFGDK